VTVVTLAFLVGDATAPLAGILLAHGAVRHVSDARDPRFGAERAALPRFRGAHSRYDGEPSFRAVARGPVVGARGDDPLRWTLGDRAVVLWHVAGTGTLAERLRTRSVGPTLPAALLEGVWFVRTKLVATAEPIRRLAFYGDLGPSMKQGTTTLASWLVPDPDAALDPADAMPHRGAIAAMAGVLLVVVVVTGVWRARRERVASSAGGSSEADRPDALRLIAAATLLVACYLGLLVVSRLVADPGIPFDERILAPVIVLATNDRRDRTRAVVAEHACRTAEDRAVRGTARVVVRRGVVDVDPMRGT
jgi:hypothetical protein